MSLEKAENMLVELGGVDISQEAWPLWGKAWSQTWKLKEERNFSFIV